MAANGEVFQDAQSQQETQVYDSEPMDVEKVNEEEVPLTQADGANDEPVEETQQHDSVVQVPASEAEEVCASEA
jgi:leucyl-tRNA synthetase